MPDKIVVVMGDKPRVYGVRILDTETGELGQSVDYSKIQEWRKEGITVEVRGSAEYEKWKEKESAREMAEKREEVTGEAPPKSPSETWESYIAKYGVKAKIPSEHIKRKYLPQLEEAARKEAEERPTTKEEFIRELERKQRIAETLAKQRAKAPPTWLVSPGVMKLYKEREPEIKRVLEREAGLKAWKEERLKREKEFEKERAKIEPYREIWRMKPSLEKFKAYYAAWFKHPKEFEAARRELRYEAVYMGGKKESLQLAAARPFTYAREKPFVTAVVIGAVAVPILGIAAKIPIIKAVVAKPVLYTVSGLWVGAKGYEAYAKYRREPRYYGGLAGKVELISEPVTEIGGFLTGAAVSAKAMRIGGRLVKTTAVKAGIKYKTGKVAPRPTIGKGKPPKPEKITLVRTELEAKVFKGKPIKEYIRIKTWGLWGKRTFLIERIKPEKIMGIRRFKPTIEWVGAKAPPLKEAISVSVTTYKAPPKLTKYDIIFGAKALKPLMVKTILTGAKLIPKYERPFGFKITGAGVVARDIVAAYKEKPFTIEKKYIYKPKVPFEVKVKGLKEGFKEIVPSFKEKPFEVEVIKPPKKKAVPTEIVGIDSLVKGIKSQLATFKEKPFEIGVEKIKGIPTTTYIWRDWTKPIKPYKKVIEIGFPKRPPTTTYILKDWFKPTKPGEVTLRIPKIVGAEVVRRELAFPLKYKAAKLYAAKGLVDVRYFRAMKDYYQMKIPREAPPPPPKELEMYYFKPIITERGVALGIRAISYPTGQIKEMRFKKPIAPIPIAKPRKKAKEIWAAPPPTEKRLPKEYVEAGAEGRRLIQIQKTKQETISKQVSKQVFKQQQAQTQKSLLISKLISKQVQKQKQKSLLASLTISAMAQEQISELAQAQKRKVLVGAISVSVLAQPQVIMPKLKPAQMIKPTLWREQLREYEQILEEPKKPKKPIGWLPFERKGLGRIEAFDVWVKRFGKFKKISARPLPKKLALRLGARETRKTLAAQFKVTPAKIKTTMRDIEFMPSAKVFRGYKIKGGRQIPLAEGQYIQFAHKRLSRVGEVREIMVAKKREEIKKKKWRF